MITAQPPKSPIIGIAEMRLDDVDSGLPKLTLIPYGTSDEHVYYLAPDAVRAFVDTLIGVAGPTPGRIEVLIRMHPSDLVKALREVNHA